MATLAAVVAALMPAAARAEPPPPPGANVPCTPSAAKPEPVILVHGTFANRTINWVEMAPRLKAAGYCVYALDYGDYLGLGALGVYATGPIERSAEQLREYVDEVLAQTGADQVDLVGHSQGGMMPRYYLKRLGGAADVDDLVAITASHYGTTNPLAAPAVLLCPACAQQAQGSRFLSALNHGDDSPGEVSYTNVVSRYDEVVTPYTNGYLDPAANVANIELQDMCPNNLSEHVLAANTPPVIELTKNALSRDGTADPGFQPSCPGP